MDIDIGDFGRALMYTCLVVVFTSLPVLLLLNMWWIDQTISGRNTLIILLIHAAITTVTIMMGWINLAIGYYVLLNLFWLIYPPLARRQSRLHLREIRDTEVAKYRRLVEEQPQNAVYLRALGDAYMAIAEYDAAIWCFRQAVRLLPEDYARDERVRLQNAERAREQARRPSRRSRPVVSKQ